MPEERSSSDDPAERERRGPRRITRRQFIPGAAGAVAALAAAGAVGYEVHGSAPPTAPEADARGGPAPGDPGSGIERFVTRPDLLPPQVILNTVGTPSADPAPRFVLLTPASDVTYEGVQRGPMLVDRQGRLVWFQPHDDSVFDANVQTYRGKPVITWWQGNFSNDGLGVGTAVIADQSYRRIASVDGHPGLPIDLHEFRLTPRGTALVTSYPTVSTDLRSVGGPRTGRVFAGHAVEIDVATGRVLLDWNSLRHVPVSESYEPLPKNGKTWDYFHLNSIAETPDGQLLISARHTSTIYKLDRRTGAIIWRLGGKRSDFRIDPEARFSYQHDAQMHGVQSDLTLFNNANDSGHDTRGLRLAIDFAARRVHLKQAYQHPAKFYAEAMGNLQVLPGGDVLVGWGWQRYFSRFSADGSLLMTAQFDCAMRSYRALGVDWVGLPGGRPAAAAKSNPEGGTLIYASWNGATEIDHWTILAGPSAHSLAPIGWQPWGGFETTIAVNSKGPAFIAVAEDRRGRELGRSAVV